MTKPDTSISNPCEFARQYWLYWLFDIQPVTISNKEPLAPHEYKPEPEYTIAGWYRGYSFKHFWSNCFFLMDEIANLDGMQQLCHQYYLQNGSLGAVETVRKIKRFLGFSL